jgi:hypothetical protein
MFFYFKPKNDLYSAYQNRIQSLVKKKIIDSFWTKMAYSGYSVQAVLDIPITANA